MSDFVVKSDIPFGSALAYTRGQTITADAVEANGWQDYVVSANTKEARQIMAEVTGEPADDGDSARQSAKASAKTSTEQKGS